MRDTRAFFGLLCAIGICLVAVNSSYGTIYYLNPASGKDGRSPAEAQNPTTPWQTLNKVKTSVDVKPGDTIRVLGGDSPYTPSQYQGESGIPTWTHTQRLGTPDHPITIEANPDDTVWFDGQRTQYWMRFFASASYDGHYVIIKNLNFKNYTGVVLNVGGSSPSTPAHHVAFVYNTIQDVAMMDSGAIGVGNAHHVIAQGNRLTNIGDPTMPGNGNPHGQHAFYISDNSAFIVLDQNYIEQVSGFGLHNWNCHPPPNAAGCAPSTGANYIERRNTVVNAHSASMNLAGATYQNIYIYNNTFYQDPVPFRAIDTNSAVRGLTFHNGGVYSNIKLLNNLAYGTWGPPFGEAPLTQDDSAQLTNLTLDHNCWTNLAGASRTVFWDRRLMNLSDFRATPGQEIHGVTGDPNFDSIPNRKFTPKPPSNVIDAGTAALTTTVGSAATPSTSLRVGDAGFFHDGYDMLPGDTIQVGSSTTTVTAVNYSSNVLTIAPAITWSNGAAVSLPYNGSAPDMGAWESGSSAPVDGIVWWTFEEGTGITTADQTGLGHTGTLTNGATWTTGLVGRTALSCDGVNDSLVAGGLLGTPATLTLAAWATVTDLPTDHGSDILSLGDHVGLHIDAGKVVGLYRDASGWNNVIYTAALVGTGWHHYVWIVNPGASLEQLYVDGILLGTGTLSTAIQWTGLGRDTYVCMHGNGNGNKRMQGAVDEVKVWGRALSAAEVAAEFGSNRARLVPPQTQ